MNLNVKEIPGNNNENLFKIVFFLISNLFTYQDKNVS
jgi:hypothetical protein